MNTAAAENPAKVGAVITGKTDWALPAWIVTGRDTIAIRAGTRIDVVEADMLIGEAEPITIVGDLVAGTDYAIVAGDGGLTAVVNTGTLDNVLGGFHFAPGGNAEARAGGDELPAINPCSLWDTAFRPACADPRGMTLIDAPHGRFWCDIYLCGTRPYEQGTSVFGATIADGEDLPIGPHGEELDVFDHPTATKIYADASKTLLSPEDFFHAALGVTEATSLGADPETTKLDAPRTSKWGLMQATGNMSTWGHDGDPTGPHRACRFGGSWGFGGWAGSRCASVGYWPGDSSVWVAARGRSDHLQLA